MPYFGGIYYDDTYTEGLDQGTIQDMVDSGQVPSAGPGRGIPATGGGTASRPGVMPGSDAMPPDQDEIVNVVGPEEIIKPSFAGYGGPESPDLSWWRDAPNFDFSYNPWAAPTYDQIGNDPGYQFRLGEGKRALEQSASGRGVLRTGGTLKDILGYGQNMASQEYQNVYNRSRDQYVTNYQNAYQQARDKFAPHLLSWQQEMGARQNASNLGFQRAWDAYTYGTPSASNILQIGMV